MKQLKKIFKSASEPKKRTERTGDRHTQSDQKKEYRVFTSHEKSCSKI